MALTESAVYLMDVVAKNGPYRPPYTIEMGEKVLTTKVAIRAMRTLIYLYRKGVEILDLPKVIPLLMSEQIHVIKNRENSDYELHPDATMDLELRKLLINEFNDKGKLVLLTDATNPIDLISKIIDCPYEIFDWGDPLNTNSKQLIIADTRNVSVDRWRKIRVNNKEQEETLQRLKKLAPEYGAENIMVVTINRRIKNIIKHWKKTYPELKGIEVTYYRSNKTEGVQSDKRKMYCVILPYSSNWGHEIDEIITDKKLADSRFLKNSENAATFIQTIGRAKDPKGEERSVVFIDGATRYRVKEMLDFYNSDTIIPPTLLQPYKQGKYLSDAPMIADLWLNEADKNGMSWDSSHFYKVEDFPVIARALMGAIEGKSFSRIFRTPKGSNKELIESLKQKYPYLKEDMKILKKAYTQPERTLPGSKKNDHYYHMKSYRVKMVKNGDSK